MNMNRTNTSRKASDIRVVTYVAEGYIPLHTSYSTILFFLYHYILGFVGKTLREVSSQQYSSIGLTGNRTGHYSYSTRQTIPHQINHYVLHSTGLFIGPKIDPRLES